MCYTVIVDPKVVQNVFNKFTPFNLDKELKYLKKNMNVKKEELEETIADEIEQIINKSKKITAKYYYDKYVTIAKFRHSIKSSNKGKSSGLRLIVLIDYINHWAILLSVYSKKEKSNLSTDEERKIKLLGKMYGNDIKEEV